MAAVNCLIIERYPEQLASLKPKILGDMSTAWYREGRCILGELPYEPEWKVCGGSAVRAHGWMHAPLYEARFKIGARLPHTRITIRQSRLQPVDVSCVTEFLAEEVHSRIYSTLDLCEPGQFNLIGDLEVPRAQTLPSALGMISKSFGQKVIGGLVARDCIGVAGC